MPIKLSESEIRSRLRELRNKTKLHEVARSRVAELESIIKEKDKALSEKDTQIAKLKSQVSNLELQLADKESQRKELAAKLFKSKKDREKAKALSLRGSTTKLPGAQPNHTPHHRPIPPESIVTDRVTFDLSVCPACKHQVGEIVDKVEKYQEDIDLAPRNKIVRHYTITRHWCPNCQEYVRPLDTPAQNLHRFGPNIVGYILYARYRLRLPLLAIKNSLSDLHDFTISEGEISNILKETSKSFEDQYELITELIKTAKVVHADETGWRMDGDNWYLWAYVDKASGTTKYEIAETRGGAIARNSLGGNSDQVIISDGYSVYDSMDSLNQQCWVHLLRSAKAKSQYAYGKLCVIYSKLLAVLAIPLKDRTEEDKAKIRNELTKFINDKSQFKPKSKTKPKTKSKTKSKALTNPTRGDPLTEKVQQRAKKHFDQLLVCLDYDNVLPENNTAERAIRPQVILRKIFGGNRTPTGANTHAINTSVITTKLAQSQDKNKGFFDVMLPVIEEVWK